MWKPLPSPVLELLLFTACPHPSPACDPKVFSSCKAWHHPNFVIAERDLNGRITALNELGQKVLACSPNDRSRVERVVYMKPASIEESEKRDALVIQSRQAVIGLHRRVELVNGIDGWIVEDTIPSVNGSGRPRLYDVARIVSVEEAMAKDLRLADCPAPPAVEPGQHLQQCAQCGAPYVQKRRWQRYCSPRCRQYAFWARQTQRP